MKIAHISDLHVQARRPVPFTRFLNKRMTGAVNLYTFRKDAHSGDILHALMNDIIHQDVHHTCITGDLSNLSLEQEFDASREEICRLGDGSRVSIVPGNHDIYTRGSQRAKRFESYFGDWLCPDLRALPYSKDLGQGVKVVGLCSAIPTLPFTSYGRVGKEQLEKLAALPSPGMTDFEIVLLHHNLHPRHSSLKDWSSGLKDREEFMGILGVRGTSMVLHGHTHVAHRVQLSGNNRPLHIFGCGSSTWTHEEHMARYAVYHIHNGKLAKIETRVFSPQLGEFQSVENELESDLDPGWLVEGTSTAA